MSKQGLYLRRLIVSAVFLSIALVIRTHFSFYIPLFGENGMRVGIAGVFSFMPAFLFGPIFGMITSGLMDLIGFILRPSGAYLPLMTVIVASGGFIRGGLWLILRGRNTDIMKIVIFVFSAGLLIFGISNHLFLRADGITSNFYDYAYGDIDTSNMYFIGRWLITRTQGVSNPGNMLPGMITAVTAAPIGGGIFGLVLLGIDIFITRMLKKNEENQATASIMPMLISALAAGITVTTLNTILLSFTAFPSWRLLPFVVVWLPRVIQEIVANTVIVYFISLLMRICKKVPSMRQIMR